MQDKRRHPRRPLAVEVHCRDDASSGELLFDTHDLSPGGAFLKSELLLEKGEPLTLEVAAPGESTRLSIRARVAWARRFPAEDEVAGMGLEFLDLDDATRRALERLIG